MLSGNFPKGIPWWLKKQQFSTSSKSSLIFTQLSENLPVDIHRWFKQVANKQTNKCAFFILKKHYLTLTLYFLTLSQ